MLFNTYFYNIFILLRDFKNLHLQTKFVLKLVKYLYKIMRYSTVLMLLEFGLFATFQGKIKIRYLKKDLNNFTKTEMKFLQLFYRN